MDYYIKGARIVNEGTAFSGSVLIANGLIKGVYQEGETPDSGNAVVIDAGGRLLLPGVIDEHVHFREPGMTHKADIHTESRAAVAGGVTSFMDMPNTLPQTTTRDLVSRKMDIAAEKSLANFSFYIGVTNENIAEIEQADFSDICGIKLFMGSSTGNMLVNDGAVLERLFKNAPCIIAAHCEDEDIISENTLKFKELVAKGMATPDVLIHPKIRTEEACYRSSAKAVELAAKNGARLHVMHISTARELELFDNTVPLKDKKITAETCPHYLVFSEEDYKTRGFGIKCNPAIKTAADKEALQRALGTGKIDTIGTDHAPHLRDEKFTNDYFTSKSGFPSIQNSLCLMLEMERRGFVSLPRIAELMSHNPATLYRIDRRGFIREGYHADLVLVETGCENVIGDAGIFYKCGWTPYSGVTVHSRVTHTFVNGNLVYENGNFFENWRGEKLEFCR
ncbi:MAG: dihydroorotase [Bacteroidales bacterium]|nr:dihydroorotase [Bacteroidales bacterium]MDY6348561.1 dihydroorotase [Bacteroidales bacterium]